MKRLKVALATSFLVAAMAVTPANAEIVRVTDGRIIDTSTLTNFPINKSGLNGPTLKFVEGVDQVETLYGPQENPPPYINCRPARWAASFMPSPYIRYVDQSSAQGVCSF